MRNQEIFTFGKLVWAWFLDTLGFVLTSFSHQGILDEKLRGSDLSQKWFSMVRILGFQEVGGKTFFFSLQHFSDHLPRYGMYFMGQSCGQKYIFQAWTLSETLYKIVLGFICAFAHVSWWVKSPSDNM